MSTAVLFNSGVTQPLDTEGNIVPLGKLYFYNSINGTKATTYTTSSADTHNPNPVILDASGRANVFLGDGEYNITFKTAEGVTVWTQDNYTPANGTEVYPATHNDVAREEFTSITGAVITTENLPTTKMTVHKNGLLLNEDEYSADGQTVTFTTPLVSSDEVVLEFGVIVGMGNQYVLVSDTPHPVDTVADMLALDTSTYNIVYVKGYHTIGDGGGDIFHYDEVQVLDNDGGYVLDGWVRQCNGIVDVREFGAVEASIGIIQDVAIQKAIDYCDVNEKILLNDLWKFSTSTGISIPDTLQMSRPEGDSVPLDVDKAESVVFVGDSLTELRTGNSSYVREIVDALANKARGYKEIGYLPMSTFITKETTDIAFVRSANMLNMWGASDTQWDTSPFTYSPDGKGMYATAADGSDFIAINFTNDLSYEKVRLYYLEQPGGGTFTYGFLNTNAVDKVTVDTSGTVEALKFIEFDAVPSDTYDIRLTDITGLIAIYGVELLTPSNTQGLNYTVFARSGVGVQDFVDLDATATDTYYSNLLPDLVFINIGTNDAAALASAVQYSANLQTYINRILSASPDTKIILINPNQPDWYYATSPYLREYDEERRSLAEDNDYGYIDLPSMIGGYGELYSLGGMVDTTHPTTTGKNLIADAVMKFLRVDSMASSDYYPTDTRELVAEQKLTDMAGADPILQTEARTIRKLGLIGVYSVAYVNLKVKVSSFGAVVVQDVKFFIMKGVTLPSGKVSHLRELIITEDLGYLSFTSTVTVTINANDEVEVTVSPDNFDASHWSVTGYAIGETLKKPNQIIEEVL